MKIGLIVDGLSEVRALPELLKRIETPNDVLHTPLKADMHPLGPPAHIALQAASRCKILSAKGVELAVVLLDLESRDECPGAFALTLRQLIIERTLDLNMQIEVVIKVRKLENWLVADLACMSQMPALFPDRARIANAVPDGNADGVDALPILDRASGNRKTHDKVRRAIEICKHLTAGRAAMHSRSFRRFLRALGYGPYADQSRRAVAVADSPDPDTPSSLTSQRRLQPTRRGRK